MSEPELKTILDDVKTIKSILLTTDAPLPAVWKGLYYVAVPGLVIIGVLKLTIPSLAAMDFTATLLWLWTPGMLLAAAIIAIQVVGALKQSGTRFLAQSRVQTFFYTRIVLAPAILILGYLLSLNPSYSLDGAMMLLVAVGMTQGVILLSGSFKPAPLVLLLIGLVELGLAWSGPWVTFLNTLAAAGALAWAAVLLQRQETRVRGAHHG